MIDMISYVPRMPERGETLLGNRFEIGFGGKGANQAVMAHRLGAKVRMIGCVGTDGFGDETVANLQAEGIDTGGVYRSDKHTGVAPIWVEPDGTNRIAIFPGANHELVAEEVASATAAGLQPGDVVVGQFEIEQHVTLAAFRAARAAGATTVLNPAPAAPPHTGLLDLADWLIPNETEFAALMAAELGKDVRTVADEDIEALAARVAPRLLVTLGGAGAVMASRPGMPGAAGTGLLRLPAPATEVVDTTGAGDAFVGAFAYGLGRGLEPATAAALAVRCASFTVSRRGTQLSFPSGEDCARLLDGLP